MEEIQSSRNLLSQKHHISPDIFHIDNINVLTILDKFSRFAVRKILDSRTSINVLEVLTDLFANRGVPSNIVTDNAKEFTLNLFKETSKKKKMNNEIHQTSQRSSTGNSPVERFI